MSCAGARLAAVAVRTRLERAALAGAMAPPERAQRALAGRPVTIDGNTLATDLQLMLRLQRLARVPGAETLPLAEGRDVLRATSALTAGDQPIGAVRSLRVADLPARLYVPTGVSGPGPLLVFLHGGGFWCGDLDSHDAPCRFQAEHAGVRVLSVDYRLAPEHPFPAAYDDAAAAYAWTVEHAAELGADPRRIGVGGDSAGGNLAAGVAIEAARHGWPCAAQLLVYPATQARRQTRSAELFGRGFYLTSDFMRRADQFYATDVPSDEPRLSPLYAELPSGLAPALVYTAGFDPLRDEGEAYAERLREAGANVEVIRFADQIHGFFNIVGVGRTSRAANLEIARALHTALA
jgi:acetyl esterase